MYRNILLLSKRKKESFPPPMAYTPGAKVAMPVSSVLPDHSKTTVGDGEVAFGSMVKQISGGEGGKVDVFNECGMRKNIKLLYT